MNQLLRRRLLGLACVATLVVAWSTFPVSAQTAAKRPLSYDVVDYWRSVGGTRLSEDGQWLAYALSSQSEDGELIVRNLASGKEFRHARGSAPVFTPDAKFVLFTIVPPKAADDDNAAGRAGGAAAGGEEGEAAGAANASRNSAGIMSLPSGQVTVVEQISTIRLAEDSSAWVAFHKGRPPAAGGRRTRGTWRRGRTRRRWTRCGRTRAGRAGACGRFDRLRAGGACWRKTGRRTSDTP
jgi:hypothetical protein